MVLLEGDAFDMVGEGANVTVFCELGLCVVWWLARSSIGSRCDFLVIVSIVACGIKVLGEFVKWDGFDVQNLWGRVRHCSPKKNHIFNLRWICSFGAKVKFEWPVESD